MDKVDKAWLRCIEWEVGLVIKLARLKGKKKCKFLSWEMTQDEPLMILSLNVPCFILSRESDIWLNFIIDLICLFLYQ